MLRPLHSLMGVLFRVSMVDEAEGEEDEELSAMISTVVKTVDRCATALVDSFESNVRDPCVFGQVVRRARRPRRQQRFRRPREHPRRPSNTGERERTAKIEVLLSPAVTAVLVRRQR